MTSVIWATQTAILELLANDSQIIALTEQEDGNAGVWNYEPAEKASMPYILFQQVSATCADTFGRHGKNMLWDVSVFSSEAGESETTAIFDRIQTILEESYVTPHPLTYDGVNFALVHEETGPRPIQDPNKGVRRMTATYRIIAQDDVTP